MTTADRSALVRAIGEDVTAAAAAIHHLGRVFADAHDLHLTDFRALTAIYVAQNAGRPITASQLADQLAVSSGAITYLVERLVDSGHLVRERDPKDRRKVVLAFADHGRAVATEFFAPLGSMIATALEGKTDEEIGAALSVLAVVNEAIGQYDDRLRSASRQP